MSELHDRLNTLAARGEPRGFDAVIDAAGRTASAGAVDGDRDGDHGPDLEPIPLVAEEPPRTRRARGRTSSMIAATGVAALVFVGVFAVSALVGSGGAGSPESVVRSLAAAVEAGDPLAAADVLSPTEVASLHDTLSTAERRAAELQLVKNASAPLSGLDLSVKGLDLRTESLGDGYAKVVIDGGTLRARTEKARFSPLMQKVLRDSTDNSSDVDLAKLAVDGEIPTFVVTVRQDGRWYASAAYTFLEYLREYNHVAAAGQFGSGAAAISTLGAATPDDAVKDAVQAIAANDWARAFALVAPDEIPLYDYRETLKELFAQSETQTDFTVDNLTTNSQVHGDTADVVLHASGTTESGRWSVDGGCYTAPTDAGDETVDPAWFPEGFCVGENANAGGLRGLLFGRLDPSPSTQSSQAITVVRHEGRWFVSPVGSALDVIDQFIGGIDRRGVYSILGIPDQLPPDGALTLGQPVSITREVPGPRVLTYEGRAGDELLGLASFAEGVTPRDYYPASVTIYGPDGVMVETGSVFFGSPATLPVDGTYKIVIDAYAPRDLKVTIWDAADAPPAAKVGPSYECFRTADSETCSASGTSIPAPATTVPESAASSPGG